MASQFGEPIGPIRRVDVFSALLTACPSFRELICLVVFMPEIVDLESTDSTVTCPPPGGLYSQQTQLEAAVRA
jgi:hypothetical protein